MNRLSIAMFLLREYARENRCNCWLEVCGKVGGYHARICDYQWYNGGARDKDPVRAVMKALSLAALHKWEKVRLLDKKADSNEENPIS